MIWDVMLCKVERGEERRGKKMGTEIGKNDTQQERSKDARNAERIRKWKCRGRGRKKTCGETRIYDRSLRPCRTILFLLKQGRRRRRRRNRRAGCGCGRVRALALVVFTSVMIGRGTRRTRRTRTTRTTRYPQTRMPSQIVHRRPVLFQPSRIQERARDRFLRIQFLNLRMVRC